MKIKRWLLPLIIAAGIGIVFANDGLLGKLQSVFSDSGSPVPTVVQSVGTIEVAFSPNNGATETVVKAVSEAKHSLLVSAYSFTSKDIAEALLDAKKRGVEVKLS